MKDKKTRDPSQEQLLDLKFKTSNGESAEDTNKRMSEFLNKILDKYKGKELNITSLCLIKLTFNEGELIDLQQID